MRDKKLANLKGKKIEIMAGGISYVGTLLEATEEYALIRRVSGHAQVPMQKITSIKEVQDKPKVVHHDPFPATAPTPATATTPHQPTQATPADEDLLSLNSSAWGEPKKPTK